jgi:hypothetical protein
MLAVRIGPMVCTVRPMRLDEPDASDADGNYDPETGAITVLASAPPWRQAELLIHETLHGMWEVQRLGETATEEEVCDKIAKALAQVIRDNPRWTTAVIKALRSDKPIV